MQNDCINLHVPNYTKTCCIKHLVLMNEYSENQLMLHRYAVLVFKTLNHFYKKNGIAFESIEHDLLKPFLEMLNKFISKFYFLGKTEYAKILSKIALHAVSKSSFRDDIEIKTLEVAVLNNLACIYDK